MECPLATRALLTSVLACLAALLACPSDALESNGVHVLFLTDCTLYSDWMAAGMAFAFANSGQQGKITRVMCCTEAEKASYPKSMLKIMDSHIAPSFEYNEKTKDHYAPFNKPGAVLDFMQHGTPATDWMLVIDSDMLLRHPFDPHQYNMTIGRAMSADYRYMIGCDNELAVRHIPEITRRNDTLAGPFGRRCDQVGGWVFMHKSDLANVAPLWLSYTVDVREDTGSWNLTGDSYVEPGGKAWIAEMYGYAFACAKSNVWHSWDLELMHYPTYEPDMSASPKLIHYGLEFDVAKDFVFDKHDHFDFNVHKCPPWDMSKPEERKAGVFQHAPRPSELKREANDRSKFYHNLLSIETVATLNAGFCTFHLDNCPASLQLHSICNETLQRYVEVKQVIREVEETMVGCQDMDARCEDWAKQGECTSNRDYMEEQCKKSCKLCNPFDGAVTGDVDGRYLGQALDPNRMPGVVSLRLKLDLLRSQLQSASDAQHTDDVNTATSKGPSKENTVAEHRKTVEVATSKAAAAPTADAGGSADVHQAVLGLAAVHAKGGLLQSAVPIPNIAVWLLLFVAIIATLLRLTRSRWQAKIQRRLKPADRSK